MAGGGGAAERPGTIDSTSMFGYDTKGKVAKPTAASAASGLKQADSAPAIWFVALVGILVVLRVVWESSS